MAQNGKLHEGEFAQWRALAELWVIARPAEPGFLTKIGLGYRKGGALQAAEKLESAGTLNATPFPLVSTTPALGAPPLLIQEGNC